MPPAHDFGGCGESPASVRRATPTTASRRTTHTPRGMSSRRINRIEAGEVDPHYDEMIALADALNVTPGTLVIYAEQIWTDNAR